MGFDLASARPFNTLTAKSIFGNAPLKIGAEGFPDALRETLANTDWGTRNIAGAGSAVVNAWEGLKGLTGNTDQSQVDNQKIIADSAPVGNIVGNMALLAPTAMIPGANTGFGAAAIGALTNAAITPGSALERVKAAGIGAVGGGTGAVASRWLSGRGAMVPSADGQLLAREGVSLTPGQNAGGAWKSLEDKATSIPWLGDVIQSARNRGIERFNKAAYNRATLPGMQVNGTVGGEAIQDIRQGLGTAYDNVLAKSSANALEPQFVQNMATLRGGVRSLPPQEAQQFDNIIARELDQRLAPNGMISGENLKAAQGALRDEASIFGRSKDAYQLKLGTALKQADAEFRALIERANPQNATELDAINKAYANFKRIQKAGGSVAAQDGVFSPAQLHNAVKVLDRSKDKRAFSEGTALMQDLSAAGKNVLPSKVGDSGTAGRTFANPFTLNGLVSNLVGVAGAIPASIAYSNLGSRAINGVVNKGVLPIANSVQKTIGDNPNATRLFLAAYPEFVRQYGF